MNKKKHDRYDVVIVGAGPAGATAGYILAKKGYKVLILDKERFPREKLCGGALTIKTIRLLERIFREPEDSLVREKVIDSKSRGYEIRYKNKTLLNAGSAYSFRFIDRYVYDHFFLNKARAAGAEVMEGEKVEDVDSDKNRVTTSAGKCITADFIIGADGVNSRVRAILSRENKLDASNWRHNLAYAVEVFIDRGRDFEHIDRPILSFGYLHYGYAWIFPNKERLVVGMGGLKRKNRHIDLPDRFRTFLNDFGLAGAGAGKIRGYPLPFGNFVTRPVYRKVLLVGDAGGLVDPMLGEGIFQAHRSGELAACAIIDMKERAAGTANKVDEHHTAGRRNLEEIYVDLLDTHLMPEFLWARRYRWFAYNKLNHVLKFRSIKLVERRFEKCAELIHGIRSYRRPWDSRVRVEKTRNL